MQGTHIELNNDNFKSSSAFSAALNTLQNQIGYNFKGLNLLRRAMTHSSFSGENNRALSILGEHVIGTSVSLRCLKKDIDTSPKELTVQLKKISEVNSCAVEGSRLGLEKIVRVSPKINATIPSIVCGAFRAIFGAIAVDAAKADDAGDVYWNVTHHGGSVGGGGDFAM
ncbi:ribonuclease III [Ranunculus cassubicifolius]